ncbi:MAG: hypothetical protein L0H71_09290, partial [Yaniella sp.]|nr:hypothetical protein [Yaniella sp.]
DDQPSMSVQIQVLHLAFGSQMQLNGLVHTLTEGAVAATHLCTGCTVDSAPGVYVAVIGYEPMHSALVQQLNETLHGARTVNEVEITKHVCLISG